MLAAKVLSKGWRDWVYQQLGSRRGKRLVICRDDLQSSYVPLWSIKQQTGLWAALCHKGLLASGAASRGELEALQWMISQGYGNGSWYRPADLCGAAAGGGQLEVLEWLVSDGYELDESTCNAAARGGQLGVLQWLRQKGRPWSGEVLCAAIAGGPHLHVVDWALEKGCAVGPSVCAAAAGKGDLQLLQHLHARKGPLDADACAAAARGGPRHWGRVGIGMCGRCGQ